ncbi:MAG: response regulator transcription factor [Candidatus Acidiferrales bacterium]
MTVMQKSYKVLVVDDHSLLRNGLRTLLETQSGVEVCGEASNGLEAIDQVKKVKPDLVVLDLTMPEMNGLDAARAIREIAPQTEILVLSMHFSEEIAREVLRTGARGYMLKSDANAELLAAVHRVRRGEQYFTTRLAATMAQSFVQEKAEGSDEAPLAGTPLTPREVEIVQLLAEGKSNKEAAAALGVSTRTVESHRNHIMHKMNFESFSDLVKFAIRKSLVEP